MKIFALLIGILSVIGCYTQEKPILVFDLENGTIDSIPAQHYDSKIIQDKTPFSYGKIDSNVEWIDLTIPQIQVYPNSNFTYKQEASTPFDLASYPIRTSVKLFQIENGVRNHNCSGSMISRKHVLTATHCLAEFNSNTLRFDSILVCPVFDKGDYSAVFECSYVQKIYLFKDWSLNEDLAVLELQEPIGNVTGWVGIGFETRDSVLLEGTFYKFSYPAAYFPSVDSTIYNGDTLYYNYGKADLVEENYLGIRYTSGIPGESGSSLIKIKNEETYTSYGVLTYSRNLMHSKFNNWKFYGFKKILGNDVNPIGPNPIENANLVVFPNPNNGRFFLKNWNINEPIDITLYDNKGEVIFKREKYSSSMPIDITNFPNGIYYLKVVTPEITILKKVVKHHVN